MCTYLSTWLVTYLPTYEKIQIQMLLYTLTKNFIEGQGNMLNPFDIILFYKVV
jgi:hypothetical protein